MALTKEIVNEITAVNLDRCNTWHALDDWTPMQWANATAGEMGELCNVLKKILRHDMGIQQKATVGSTLEWNVRDGLIADAAQEIGDTYIYLDLLARSLDSVIDPWFTIDVDFEPYGHVSEWGCDLARRVGIVCGTAECGKSDDPEDAMITGQLCGSVVAVLTVIAELLDLDIEDCIRDTFNRVSEREGLPQRL